MCSVATSVIGHKRIHAAMLASWKMLLVAWLLTPKCLSALIMMNESLSTRPEGPRGEAACLWGKKRLEGSSRGKRKRSTGMYSSYNRIRRRRDYQSEHDLGGRSGVASAGPHTTATLSSFNATELIGMQVPNEHAPALDLDRALHPDKPILTTYSSSISHDPIFHPHFETLSLDEMLGLNGVSREFNRNAQFREDLRLAIRTDVFHSTPAFRELSPETVKVLLRPDSSLEGSWRCSPPYESASAPKMKRLTEVLRRYLKETADPPLGDEVMNKLGTLCGPEANGHWIDIIGINDRKLNHSWHQDVAASKAVKTVMWGFPRMDNYHGTGVFSHIVKLEKERLAGSEHPDNTPLVYRGSVDEGFVVRPFYEEGKEILVYRDVDVIHSAPDVTFRSSVMRFM